VTLRRPARILVVGSGAREHAIAWRLAGEDGVAEVLVAPGSAGIAAGGRVSIEPGANPLDGPGLVDLARRHGSDLVVIGPEAPLAAGVADDLRAAGLSVFGPGAAAARIETSKAWCHEVADAAGVRMARAAAFEERAPAIDFARGLAAAGRGVVIKADGLAAGKGVTVCDAIEEAEIALAAIFEGQSAAGGGARHAGPVVVVEERLFGLEASVIALCDGRDALALPAARDHKRLLDGDRGPNTGGMGAYSPLPDVPDADVAEIVATVHRPLLAELARRGSPFRGALYAGLILTAEGPVLLECNARFGDPETQVLLPRLGTDLGPLLLAAADGELASAARVMGIDGPLLPAVPGAAVGIVLAAAGYPEAPRRGDPIAGLAFASEAGALVFHAGTAALPNGRFTTAGGRILTVVGQGSDLAAARRQAEAGVERIAFTGMQRRNDIAAVVPAGPRERRPAVAPVADAAPASASTVPAAATGARR
jgi:phosphoribosylamine--glycine ligase